jgi:hypothetical protein
VIDAAITIEEDGQAIVQLHSSCDRNFKGAARVAVRTDIEVTVAAQAPTLSKCRVPSPISSVSYG